MPLRLRRFRQYELRRDWMSYFVSIEQLGRRVAHQTGSIDRSINFKRVGASTFEVFETEAAALERFHRDCLSASEERQLVADETTTHMLTEDDADVSPVEESLERAVLEADSADAAAVYADWLLANGDVRGEIATRFLQGRDAEARQLISDSRRALFGRFEHDAARVELAWRNGFLRGAAIGWKHEHLTVAETALHFLGLPVCRMLSTVTLQYPRDARFEQPPFSQAPVIDVELMKVLATSTPGPRLEAADVPGNRLIIEHLAQLPSLRRLTLRFGEAHGRSAFQSLLGHPLMERLTDLSIRPRGFPSQAAIEEFSRLILANAATLAKVRLTVGFPVSRAVRSALGQQLVVDGDGNMDA